MMFDETITKTHRMLLAPLDDIFEEMQSGGNSTLNGSVRMMKKIALLLVSNEDSRQSMSDQLDEMLSALEKISFPDDHTREIVEMAAEMLSTIMWQMVLSVACGKDDLEGEMQSLANLRQYKGNTAKELAVRTAKGIWAMDEKRGTKTRKSKMIAEIRHILKQRNLYTKKAGERVEWSNKAIWTWLKISTDVVIPEYASKPGPQS